MCNKDLLLKFNWFYTQLDRFMIVCGASNMIRTETNIGCIQHAVVITERLVINYVFGAVQKNSFYYHSIW